MATTAAPETKTTRSFQGPVKILVCIDGSPEASLALKRAIQMKKPDDTLLLVAIAKEHKPKWYNTPGPFALTSLVDAQTKDEERQSDRHLYRFAHKASKLKENNYQLIRATGENIGQRVCEVAEGEKADIIVMGRRGMGTVSRLVLGSVSKYVVEHASADVHVVHSGVKEEVLQKKRESLLQTGFKSDKTYEVKPIEVFEKGQK